MSEEKRFRSGFTGVPNALYLSNLNDRDALYAFLRFEGDTFFGGLKTVREYEQILKLGHRRVKRLLTIWQAQMSQPSSNRISTESQPDVSTVAAQGCGDGVPKPTEQMHTNQPTPSIYVQKQNQKQKEHIHTSLPQGEATPPPNPLPSKAKAKSDSLTELARALWPKLVAEAALGGKVWSEEPGKRQLQIVKERLSDSGEEDCIKAVQGYRAKAQGSDGDWDASKFFSVTSIFRPRNFDANVDAAPGSEVDSWAEAERAIKRRMAEATEAEADNLVRFDFKMGGK